MRPTDRGTRRALALVLGISRFVLGTLLTSMAIAQLNALDETAAAIANHLGDSRSDTCIIVQAKGVARPPRWSRRLASLVAASELVSGIGILGSRQTRNSGARLGLAVAGFWAMIGIYGLATRKEVPNCGCFGRYFPQRLGLKTLLEDAGFFVLALITYQDAERAKRGQPS
jgi:hypothetical protein